MDRLSLIRLNLTVRFSFFKDDQVSSFINLLLHNPFGKPEHIIEDFDTKQEHKKFYNPEKLSNLIRNKVDFTLYTRSGDDFVEINLIFGKNGTTFIIIIQNPNLIETYKSFEEYVLQIVKMLPEVSSGYTYSDSADYNDTYLKQGLEYPPACFKLNIRWIHFLGPKYYSLFFSREELMMAPFEEIIELENKTIGMKTFQNPFEWNTPSTWNKIRVITEYLNSKNLFTK